jgi:hypothetical protein
LVHRGQTPHTNAGAQTDLLWIFGIDGFIELGHCRTVSLGHFWRHQLNEPIDAPLAVHLDGHVVEGGHGEVAPDLFLPSLWV